MLIETYKNIFALAGIPGVDRESDRSAKKENKFLYEGLKVQKDWKTTLTKKVYTTGILLALF